MRDEENDIEQLQSDLQRDQLNLFFALAVEVRTPLPRAVSNRRVTNPVSK